MHLSEPDAPTSKPPAEHAPGTGERDPKGKAVEQEKSCIFGSFWLGNSEFAVPVSAIREVVNEPDTISALPLAPPFLLGLFNLRGLIIPIVDLRLLLELPKLEGAEGSADRSKVAIIENGDKCVGILFDRAGEVLNKPGSTRVNFRANDGGVKDVVIDGVLKLDDGARMVQIINPYELLRIERVPQTEAAAFQNNQWGKLGKRLSCVSFQLGHTNCAMDLRYVQEVKDMPPLDKSLLAHGYVIGTVNLRGKTIPIVDFRSFIGPEPVFSLGGQALSQRKLLVMQTNGGLIGLMVYSIDSIIPFFESDILPFAELALPRGDIVKGCLVNDDRQLVMLLDHERLMADPGLAEPAKICSDIHENVNEAAKETESELHAERRTFILFSSETSFAMDTRMVSEVINKPEFLLEPPYARDFVEGIINLRGELITLIDLRRLYGLKPLEEGEKKVVIFTHKTLKYAILVDSVDEIVMTTADKISEKDGTSGNHTISNASEDVTGVLHCAREGKDAQLVMIMDVNALVKRCRLATD